MPFPFEFKSFLNILKVKCKAVPERVEFCKFLKFTGHAGAKIIWAKI
jgi:hypothetical protein